MRRADRRPLGRAPSRETAAADANPSSPDPLPSVALGERTVKKLKLSKALTIAETTLVSNACRRMAHRKVNAVLLTDANGLLSGIVTDKDIAVRVVAEGLRPNQTNISKIMTRNPVYVTWDTMAIEALQKMIQGKFRHLPVVENGDVIGMLDITKCLYDAILRMEKVAEQESAFAAAVEGVERQWDGNSSAHYGLMQTLRDKMFRPSVSTIIMENTKLAIVCPSDPVYLAAKKMRDHHVNSVIIVSTGKPQGILTSNDVLMRVVAHNLSPELTHVEKVMTASPQCAKMDTTILDALHIMHNGNFLHLPVVDNDGSVIACLDVLQITHAAASLAEGGPMAANDMTNLTMQKFWDSALSLESPDDESETQSELSVQMASESGETTRSTYPPLSIGNLFYFKFEDPKGRMHRFSCEAESLEGILSVVKERCGTGNYTESIQLLYDDDEGDRILLSTDSDLIGAVSQARISGLKVLRLHLQISDGKKGTPQSLGMQTTIGGSGLMPLRIGVLTGAVLLTSVAIMVYLKRSTL